MSHVSEHTMKGYPLPQSCISVAVICSDGQAHNQVPSQNAPPTAQN